MPNYSEFNQAIFKSTIFLDVDGVLNCQRFCESEAFQNATNYFERKICQQRIELVSSLCRSIEAGVVVSSSWRKGRSIAELQAIFDSRGASFTVIGKTASLTSGRGEEINHWLKLYLHPSFNRYVIIDDDGDILHCQLPHFFQTNDYDGLTQEICDQIKAFFTNLS